jgi:DNA polymerase-3 subunit gamma/tau
MVDAFLAQNISQTLLLFDEILDKGFDGHIFINGLASHLRDLLVCKDEITLQLLEVSAGIKEQYKVQARKCSPYFLFEALNLCSRCDIQYKASKNQRLHVELSLIQICNTGQEKKKSSIETNSPTTGNTTKGIPTPQATNKTGASTPSQGQQRSAGSSIPSFSLKDALKNDKSTVNKPSETEKPADKVEEPVTTNNTVTSENNFTSDQLAKAWQDFSDTLKETNQRLYSMLTSQPPALKDNFVVEFCLSNQLLEDEIQKIKFSLVNFLRTKLLNSKVELQTIVSESQQSQRFYTDKEKFDHMAQKNPNLLKFKQQFGLDFG